jgi:hypothetical protein
MEHLEEGRSRYSRKRIRGELTSGARKEGKCPYLGKLERIGEADQWRSTPLKKRSSQRHGCNVPSRSEDERVALQARDKRSPPKLAVLEAR